MHVKQIMEELSEEMVVVKTRLDLCANHLDGLDNPQVRGLVVEFLKEAHESAARAVHLIGGNEDGTRDPRPGSTAKRRRR